MEGLHREVSLGAGERGRGADLSKCFRERFNLDEAGSEESRYSERAAVLPAAALRARSKSPRNGRSKSPRNNVARLSASRPTCGLFAVIESVIHLRVLLWPDVNVRELA